MPSLRVRIRPAKKSAPDGSGRAFAVGGYYLSIYTSITASKSSKTKERSSGTLYTVLRRASAILKRR